MVRQLIFIRIGDSNNVGDDGGGGLGSINGLGLIMRPEGGLPDAMTHGSREVGEQTKD